MVLLEDYLTRPLTKYEYLQARVLRHLIDNPGWVPRYSIAEKICDEDGGALNWSSNLSIAVKRLREKLKPEWTISCWDAIGYRLWLSEEDERAIWLHTKDLTGIEATPGEDTWKGTHNCKFRLKEEFVNDGGEMSGLVWWESYAPTIWLGDGCYRAKPLVKEGKNNV